MDDFDEFAETYPIPGLPEIEPGSHRLEDESEPFKLEMLGYLNRMANTIDGIDRKVDTISRLVNRHTEELNHAKTERGEIVERLDLLPQEDPAPRAKSGRSVFRSLKDLFSIN